MRQSGWPSVPQMPTAHPWARTKPDNRLRGRRGKERRKRWLEANPLCVHCCQAIATIVDHVIPLSKGGTDDESNLQSLCAECDKAKTAADLGRTIKPVIGIDGYPVV